MQLMVAQKPLDGIICIGHYFFNNNDWWGPMTKTYQKPTVVRRESLATIAREVVSLKHAVSDARLKTEITRIGTAPQGFGLYTWRYLGQPETWQGVIAQDVMKTIPEAVKTRDNGLLSVDYDQLGLKMVRVH